MGNVSLVSGLTIASRLLGLLRDVLFFTCFGVSLIGDAFILAFTVPNLFRRMLGEGTLSSAFIPVYSEKIKKGQIQLAEQILNQVLSRLMIFLFVLTIIICLFSWATSNFGWITEPKWISGLSLNSIVFPYVFLICVSAIMVGALNTHGKFFAGAFSPIILNLSMICILTFCYFIASWRDFELATSLCFAVLIGGFFQMVWPWLQLRRSCAWKWKIDFSSSAGLEKIKSLFVVGVFGAAVGQVNIMVSRFLAYSLEDEGALSYLFLSARLIELPLGVFALSISTVFFPELSRAFSSGEKVEYQRYFARGFRLTLAIILPAAIGLALLANSILGVLFQWGEFGRSDVVVASEVLLVSCFALPFYALAAFFVKAFHSQKKMGVPLNAAIISFVVNLTLSLVLMEYFGMFGLAWANVISAFVQTVYLAIKLDSFGLKALLSNSDFSFRSIIFSSLIMFIALYFVNQMGYFGSGKWDAIFGLIVTVPLGVTVYAVSLTFLGFPELKKIRKKILFPSFIKK
ncbi:MAG: murein biosynthesis integral membrane protein MurJ [Opitutae bacterium]|nr:murein biosynthesis integral membrane protein MurJ [Opitutae bacterium]MBT5715902.1 murein biosynthesis integral membrane protein MurJ [Opitutae bacterium]